MSDDTPRHFAKGATRRTRPADYRSAAPDPPPSDVVPPRLRESERLRERMRAQRLGGPEDLPPPPGRPGPPQPERRLPGWVLPVLLGTVAVVTATAAFLLNRSDTPADVAAPTPATPVLSARRVPELVAAPVANRRLQADLSAFMTGSPADSCLVVQSGSEALFAQNPTVPLAPASNQKLVTGTAALLSMGPDATLDTVASTTAAPAGGVVEGDVYVVGGGDPVLTTGPFAQQLYKDRPPSLVNDPAKLADAIKAAGITRITGSIVGDGSRYDTQRFHPTWPERYQPQNVVGQLGALMIDDGYEGFPPQYEGEQARTPAPDAAAHAALKLTTLLRERGVAVDGAPRSGTAPAGATLTTVATLPSAPLVDIVGEMLTESDDDTAELLMKEIGKRESGTGTWDAGVAATGQLLNEAGIDMTGVAVVDGSGLSNDNRATCQFLTSLLTRPDTGPQLVEHSSVAGETGTLLADFEGTPVDGRMHAKTGTLNTVTALAGRVDPLQGGSLVFSYIANAPSISASSATEWRKGLAEILVAYPRGVDIAALQPAAAPS